MKDALVPQERWVSSANQSRQPLLSEIGETAKSELLEPFLNSSFPQGRLPAEQLTTLAQLEPWLRSYKTKLSSGCPAASASEPRWLHRPPRPGGELWALCPQPPGQCLSCGHFKAKSSKEQKRRLTSSRKWEPSPTGKQEAAELEHTEVKHVFFSGAV